MMDKNQQQKRHERERERENTILIQSMEKHEREREKIGEKKKINKCSNVGKNSQIPPPIFFTFHKCVYVFVISPNVQMVDPQKRSNSNHPIILRPVSFLYYMC